MTWKTKTGKFININSMEFTDLSHKYFSLWFQQDNCPAHNARIVANFLDHEGINVLEWPSHSPDLNPIETMWAHMANNMEKRIPDTREDLLNMVLAAYNALPPDFIRKLCVSFRKRLRMCLRVRGDSLPY